MKKLWTVLGLLLHVVYLLGRRSAKSVSSPPIVVTPPDVHVYLPEQGRASIAGRLFKTREGLDRYKILVDPYVIAIVALIGSMAAGWFAYESNQVNQRLASIQALQALPVFRFGRELERNPDGSVNTDWILVSNVGGLARNITIEQTTWVSFSWITDKTPVLFGGELPVNSQSLGEDIPESLLKEEVRLGAKGDVNAGSDFLNKGAEMIKNKTGATIMFSVFSIEVHITYQDYQGNERDEFYLVVNSGDPQEIPTRASAMSVSEGQKHLRDAQQGFLSGYFVPLLVNDNQISDLVDQMIARASQPPATPTL